MTHQREQEYKFPRQVFVVDDYVVGCYDPGSGYQVRFKAYGHSISLAPHNARLIGQAMITMADSIDTLPVKTRDELIELNRRVRLMRKHLQAYGELLLPNAVASARLATDPEMQTEVEQ